MSLYTSGAKVTVVGALAALLMMAWLIKPRHHQPDHSPDPIMSPKCAQTLDIWARGVHHFDLSIRATLDRQVTAISASGQLHIIPTPTHVELALADATVQGKPTDGHQRVRLQLDPSGELTAMTFHPAITPTARGVLAFLARALAGPTQNTTPQTWQQPLRGPEGLAMTMLEHVCTPKGQLVQQATRTKWRALYMLGNQPINDTFSQNDAQTIKTFSNHLDTLQHHTALTREHPTPLNLVNVLTMHRLAQKPVQATRETSKWIVASAYPTAPVGVDLGKRLLVKRISGLTWTQMHDAIVKHDASGVMPDHERWLWRATGLLKLRPELSGKLARLALDERLRQPGKLLIMDLLANVGHAQAQEAILTVLNDRAVYGTSAYAPLASRALLLTTPTLATAQAFAKHVEDAPNASTFATSAAILGASIARVDTHARPALISTLMAPCAKTCDADTRADVLVGMGNAGAPQTTALVKAQIQHSAHPEHTSRALLALRRVDTAEARAMLIGAIAQPRTTHAALSALSQHTLKSSEAQTLITTLKEAPLTNAHNAALLNALTQLGQKHPQHTLDMIDHLRAQARITGRERAALMRLRRQIAFAHQP